MQKQEKKKKFWDYAKFLLRWGIAVLGIWYVISQISWYDRVLVVWPNAPLTVPTQQVLARTALDSDHLFYVLDSNGKRA